MDVSNAVDRVPELKKIINPENQRSEWLKVPEDLAESTISYCSKYFNNPDHSFYKPGDLLVEGGRQIMPAVRNQDNDKLKIIALADYEGNVMQIRIKLVGTTEFVMIEGKALEDTAKAYFDDKESSKE